MAIRLILNANQFFFWCFKAKFYEGRVSKHKQKIDLIVPSTWINPCCGISLIVVASLANFKTMCRRSINITK